MLKKTYNIRSGYKIRQSNAPYVDSQPDGAVYQPDVYELAFFFARRAGLKYIIDIGAGEGEKLKVVSNEFEIIAIECDTNITALRKNLPGARVIEHDLERGLPYLEPQVLSNAVVISSDVIEHIVEPHNYLKGLSSIAKLVPYVLISTPDRTRARGAEDFGPPINPFHVREWTIDELYGLFIKYGISSNIGYTVSNDQDLYKGTILAIAGTETIFNEVENKSVKAIMTTYNEEDIVEQSIRHAVSQGMKVHVIDNWSTDSTLKIVKKLTGELPQVTYEQFPEKKPKKSIYDWTSLLDRVTEIASDSEEDWIVHNDADEFRISPWRNVSLIQAISFVDSLGYNAIDLTVMDFRPTKDGFTAKHDPSTFYYNFEFTQLPSYLQQIKIWKNQQVVDLSSTGGHIAQFDNQKVFPIKFASKHYPLRSIKQAKNKIFTDRVGRISNEEKAKGWHTQYSKYTHDDSYIWNEKYLSKYTPGNYYNDYLVERFSGIGILPRK